jgi:hypothetical protein
MMATKVRTQADREERQHTFWRLVLISATPVFSLGTLSVAITFFIKVNSFMLVYENERIHDQKFKETVQKFMEQGGRVTDSTLTDRLKPIHDAHLSVLDDMRSDREVINTLIDRMIRIERDLAVMRAIEK